MGRGRKPLAKEHHEQAGSYIKDPQRRNELAPIAKSGRPKKPRHVSADKIASKCWDDVCGILASLNVLSGTDAFVIEAYAVNYAGYRRALEDVLTQGQTMINEDGKLVRNPASFELHKYLDRLTKQIGELGLSPSSRTRLEVNKQEDDKFFDFLQSKRN